MIRRTPLVIAAAAILAAGAFAQAQQSALSLRIQSTFRAADVNKNGTISIREAAAAGIPPTSFAKNDLNKDRRLSSNEFGGYYRNLLVVRRKEQAQRVAAKAAKRKGRSFKPVTAPSQPGPTAAPKTGVLPGTPAGKPAGAKPASAKPSQPVAGPVQPAPVQPTPKVAPTADVAKKNREILQAGAVGKRFVKGLQSKGKLGQVDSDLLIKALTLPKPGKTAAENFVEWRAALNNARTRIGALVQAKALSVDEGRELYRLFEQRAKDAVGWEASGGVTQVDPAPTKPNTSKPGSTPIKVADKVAGKPAPVLPTSPDADNVAARKEAYAEKEAAAKREHDRRRVEAARARLAEQQAKDQAAKDQRAKQVEAKRRAAEAAKKSKPANAGKTVKKADSVTELKINSNGKAPSQPAKIKPSGKTPTKPQPKKAAGKVIKASNKNQVKSKSSAPKKG